MACMAVTRLARCVDAANVFRATVPVIATLIAQYAAERGEPLRDLAEKFKRIRESSDPNGYYMLHGRFTIRWSLDIAVIVARVPHAVRAGKPKIMTQKDGPAEIAAHKADTLFLEHAELSYLNQPEVRRELVSLLQRQFLALDRKFSSSYSVVGDSTVVHTWKFNISDPSELCRLSLTIRYTHSSHAVF